MEQLTSSKYRSKSRSFIEACRQGDIEQVRQLLSSITNEELNSTDADGNTGLHLACIHDNYDLVFLLLHSNIGTATCSCTILNKYGLSAYECVRSERVRLLFDCLESTDNSFMDISRTLTAFRIIQISHTRFNGWEIVIPKSRTHDRTNTKYTI